MDLKLKREIKNYKIKNKRNGYIFDTSDFKYEDEILNSLAKVLKDGITLIQLKNSNLTDKDFLSLSKKFKQLCSFYDSTFIIENRFDITYFSDADGICLDDNSLDIVEIKKILSEETIIGYKYKNEEKIKIKNGVDYIIIPSPLKSTGADKEYVNIEKYNNLVTFISSNIKDKLSSNLTQETERFFL